MPKSGRRGSRGRKPLADISNGVKASRTSKREAHGDGGASPRDRLLLARADLSKLISQIDELVMQALKHKFTNEESKEIESFIHVVSDMHSSLKSSIPRLKQALVSSAVEPGFQSEISLPNKSFSDITRVKKSIPNGPNRPELGLVVSPSPLVSWRDNGACTVEGGRQLFLLTPLHKPKLIASKGSLKCLQGKLDDNDVVEKADVKLTPNKFLVPESGALESTSETGFVSQKKVSNCNDNLIYCLSPYVKTTPLKTCILLDPVSNFIQQDKKTIRKGTPWVARTRMNNASPVSHTLTNGENSHNCGSDEISTTLASKYLELFSLQPAHNPTVPRKEVDESLDWIFSPPKTCVLMEPADEQVVLPSARDKHPLNSEHSNLKLVGPEVTPLWNDLESTAGHCKQAGETTLKRELWTKFEAVSTNGLHFDRSGFQQISRNRFLDMLEEVW
uniref:Hemerythrin n=1 Tax=Anthurium amnicola TaxID=1678845 RepID=A0A1D1XH40_9ARAE